jgi:hypothetical protein
MKTQRKRNDLILVAPIVVSSEAEQYINLFCIPA